jgi:hypothetical protein
MATPTLCCARRSMLPDRVPPEIYAMVADPIGWDPALVRAIARQESAENPNWIRFEKHIWKRYRMASRAAQAFDNAGNAKTIPERWAKFDAIDAVCREDALINPAARDAAVLAHSIGFGQPMGFNHKFCGFNSAQAFWQAQKSLEGQGMATLNFIRSSPRLVELGRRLDLSPRKTASGKLYKLGDLSEISSIWNGPGYEKNKHDAGLKAHLAFARKEAGNVARIA